MASVQNRGRSKFFLCCRSVAVHDGSANPCRKDVSGDSVPPYISAGVGGKGSTAISNVAGAGWGKKEKPHRRFSNFVKKVLFHKSLIRKICKRKSQQKLLPFNSNLSSAKEKILKPVNENTLSRELSESERINLNRFSSMFLSSTNASTSLCSTRANSIGSSLGFAPEQKVWYQTNSGELKQSSTTKFIRHFSIVGFCVLLLCLLVLILCGRTCAIFCTSSCLYFAPRRFNGVALPDGNRT